MGITGGFRVPRENDNGSRVIDFWAERGLHIGNIYFSTRVCISTPRWQEAKMEWR